MRLLVLCALIGVTSSAPVFDDQILLAVPRLKDALNSHPLEWIQGPDTHLYQFHVGEQNWLSAREYCLARNSDLALIKNKDQLKWLLSHYNPIVSEGTERVVQIGALKSDHQWKWVDGAELKTDTVSWHKDPELDETCALLQLNNSQLAQVACDKVHLARFICQRTNNTHEKQQRSDNFFWSRLESLFDYFGIGKGDKTSTEKPVPDYYDNDDADNSKESSKELNITSAERKELASIPVKLSSSEEQDQVENVLNQLSKVPSVLPEKPVAKTARSSEEDGEQGADFQDLKVHRAPAKNLKELSEIEGSGHLVDRSDINAEEPITVEDPKKLQTIIDNMEKMLADIEKIKVPGDEKVNKEEKTSSPEDNLLTTDAAKDSKNHKKSDDKKPKVAGVKNNVVTDDLEKDFDSKEEQSMPRADIEPPAKDDDCEENEDDSDESDESNENDEKDSSSIIEGSGEEEQDEKEDDSKLQKPTIPKEREEHIKKFLQTLRVFLARASHDDLKSVLENKAKLSLLERMEQVIKKANAREFARLEAGDEVANAQQDDVVMMDEKEQEDLFKRISDVVLDQAQKEGILHTATEPSVRTTTEEAKIDQSSNNTKQKRKTVAKDEDVESSGEEDTDRLAEQKAVTVKSEVVKKVDVVKKQPEAIEKKITSHKDVKTSDEERKFSKLTSKLKYLNSNKRRKHKRKSERKQLRKLIRKAKRVQLRALRRETLAAQNLESFNKSKKKLEKLELEVLDLDDKHVKRQQRRRLYRQHLALDKIEKKEKNSKKSAQVHHAKVEQQLKSLRKQNRNAEQKSDEVPKVTVEKSTTIASTTTSTTVKPIKKAPTVKKEKSHAQDKDERNPLGLPTLPAVSTLAPLPTFAPLPTIQEVFEKFDKSFKDLFKPLPTIPPPKF